LENQEILKALRELQGTVDNIDQRAAGGPLAVPAELKAGANITPEARAKVLNEYTARVYDLPSKQWTKEQAALVKEQIQTVLAGL
jgi:hypothetical protein